MELAIYQVWVYCYSNDFFIIDHNGQEIPIKRGIKNINQKIVEQLLKGNTEFMIKARPTKSE